MSWHFLPMTIIFSCWPDERRGILQTPFGPNVHRSHWKGTLSPGPSYLAWQLVETRGRGYVCMHPQMACLVKCVLTPVAFEWISGWIRWLVSEIIYSQHFLEWEYIRVGGKIIIVYFPLRNILLLFSFSGPAMAVQLCNWLNYAGVGGSPIHLPVSARNCNN